MTDEDVRNWEIERDIARSIQDPDDRRKACEKVYDHRDRLMMTCIAHQSGRVKEIKERQSSIDAKVDSLNSRMKPLEAHNKEVQEAKLKFSGAKFGFGLAMILVGKFGWDAINSIWTAITTAH